MTYKNRTLQEWKDWWIDGLIERGIPMLDNRLPNGELTEGCIHAMARGARLVTRDKYRVILAMRSSYFATPLPDEGALEGEQKF